MTKLAGGVVLCALAAGACGTDGGGALPADAAAPVDADGDAPVDAYVCPPWTGPLTPPTLDAVADLLAVERQLLDRHDADGRFPMIAMALTPGVACCAQAGRVCPMIGSDWITWDGYPLTRPTAYPWFQYMFDSRPDHVVVTARADLDCDTTTIDLVLECTSSAGVASCQMFLPTCAD